MPDEELTKTNCR